MLIQDFNTQDWPEREPTVSQERAAHVRSEIATLAESLEQLNPSLPRFAEQGFEDLRDLKFLIQRLQHVLDENREYWDKEYLQEVDAL